MNNNNFPFKEGDWIVSNDEEHHHVGLIKSLKNGMCLFADGNGMSQLAVEEDYHLWRIEDAQDGDVIANDYGDIMIFRTIIDCSHIYGYVIYSQESNEIHIESSDFSNYHPATSEQCNLLWQKMKEAGYKWNPFAKEIIKSSFKLKETLLSARDRGTIDEIIFALRTLGKEKMICYTEEIKFLEKIRKL